MHRYVAPVLVTLASAAVHTVQVGQSGLSFVPRTISAVQGDTVVFELFPGHNVVEGNFDSPCQTDDDDCKSATHFSVSGIATNMRGCSLQRTVLGDRQWRQKVRCKCHQ